MFPSVKNSTTDLSTQLGQSKVTTTQQGGGKAYMRFDPDTGIYSFGKEAEDITDEEIVVNTQSFCHGWTLWHQNKPTKREVHFTQELPEPMDGIAADSPSESRSFQARFADDDEVILSYGTTTYGGKKGCDALLDAIKIKAAAGEKEFLYPVVKLTSESYANSKRGGKLTFNPIFTIVDWMNGEGELESATPKLTAKPKRGKRKTKTAPAYEVDDEVIVEEIEEEVEEEVEEEAAPKASKRRRKRAS